MNARTEPALLAQLNNQHLDALEEETIFLLREVAGAFERPALLFSGGKDSLVLLKCAEKAFGTSAKAVVLKLCSPGGDAAGCYETSRALRAMPVT